MRVQRGKNTSNRPLVRPPTNEALLFYPSRPSPAGVPLLPSHPVTRQLLALPRVHRAFPTSRARGTTASRPAAVLVEEAQITADETSTVPRLGRICANGGRWQHLAPRQELEGRTTTTRPEHFTCRTGPKKPRFFGLRNFCPRPSHGTCQASVFGAGSGRPRAWAGRPRILV
jgi:hypothetical protein